MVQFKQFLTESLQRGLPNSAQHVLAREDQHIKLDYVFWTLDLGPMWNITLQIDEDKHDVTGENLLPGKLYHPASLIIKLTPLKIRRPTSHDGFFYDMNLNVRNNARDFNRAVSDDEARGRAENTAEVFSKFIIVMYDQIFGEYAQSHYPRLTTTHANYRILGGTGTSGARVKQVLQEDLDGYFGSNTSQSRDMIAYEQVGGGSARGVAGRQRWYSSRRRTFLSPVASDSMNVEYEEVERTAQLLSPLSGSAERRIGNWTVQSTSERTTEQTPEERESRDVVTDLMNRITRRGRRRQERGTRTAGYDDFSPEMADDGLYSVDPDAPRGETTSEFLSRLNSIIDDDSEE